MKVYRILRQGGTVTIEGVDFVMDGDGTVQNGDSYIAERNTGPTLLTAKRVNESMRWILPVENEYSYDTHECVKVKIKEE